ncbi:NAD-dependent epimerase/dehydratase family protein [Candidatus Thioglobus sp.]|nr:NAD-dependent epimerase/dehydratase family protein [Candidatus Thioglobus sp.]
MSSKLLIIGGTGFIGKKLAKEALKKGFDVTIISLNKPKKKINEIKYIQVDINNKSELQKILPFNSFQYVVNLSGYVDHSSFLDGGRSVINTHFNGLQNILELIDWHTLKKFVQIGSSDEYGNLEAPQDESMKEMPISPYSFAKMSATNLLKMLHITHQFPVVILRFFLVYGPGQEENRFLPQIINGCFNNRDFPVSDGNQLRDFCYIDDAISAILISFSNSKINGEVINIASGNAISIREVITIVQEKIGYGLPLFGKIPYRIGENMQLYANISKAKNLLKWTPVTSIEVGITKTINSFTKKEGID